MSYSLDTLEFGRLLELLGRFAQTPMGFERVLSTRPMPSRVLLERAIAAVSETIFLKEEKQISWSFSGVQESDEAVAILKIQNAALEPIAMLDLTSLCTRALFAKSAIQTERDSVPILWQFVEPIASTLLTVTELINKKILPSGEIDDSASPELAKLRREINAQRARLTKSLEAAMRSAGSAIQDEIVTVRNDRFVIPVKSDFRTKVNGVAHGFSSSGQTVYVEPLEAIEANNELQNLRGKEEREVARILFTLTEQLRSQLPAIEAAVAAVAELDFIKAKVEFAKAFNCVVPHLTDDTLELVDARHPLLEENLRRSKPADNTDSSAGAGPGEIVPSSFTLTGDQSVMIISGANAGGKTVVIKTAGILSLMAVSGLPVSARSAKIPFYKSVLADIGDHQSLSANLSTFSSHMANIASMIKECQPPSLVLLDEAGTGTDPDEGSALGVAIVDHFRRAGAHIVASTHYRGLKMYAANDENVINASVEFDEKTLQPTYKLLIGLAGASSGIEIARRFGIDQAVIEAARRNLDASSQEAEKYLQKLQSETRQSEDLLSALEEERAAVALKYASLDLDAAKKEKTRQKEFENRLAQAVDDFDRQSKAFLKTIEDKALKNRLEKERASRKAELNRAVLTKVGDVRIDAHKAESSFAADELSRGQALSAETISRGVTVITSLGKTGVVEKFDKEFAEVIVGSIRLREKISDLSLSTARPADEPKNSINAVMRPIDAGDSAAELNLIGRTTAEADYELDRFIDEAYMSSLSRIRIIHGFGTGALKNFVHHFLKNSDLVERFEFAPSSQGGNGATIAELKQ